MAIAKSLSLTILVGAVLTAHSALAQTKPELKMANTPPAVSKPTFLTNMDRDFAAMDANKDKIVTKAEMEQYMAARVANQRTKRNAESFARLDSDKNGALSPQEFAALAGPAPKINVEPLIAKTDANRDKQISDAEYRAGAIKEFDTRDTNKNGMLSVEEIQAKIK